MRRRHLPRASSFDGYAVRVLVGGYLFARRLCTKFISLADSQGYSHDRVL